ncbi:MAG: glycerate kinase [Acidimicrobiales bacterium]
MFRLLAVPDKFRGTLSAASFRDAAAAGAAQAGWTTDGLEMSDGGEGFCRSMAPHGEPREELVTGPLGQPARATWRLIEKPDRKVAIIESASACGLELAGGPELNRPVAATTHGVGQLISAAVRAGANRIVVGCGGSASTDGGRGALEALGAFPPTSRNRLAGIELIAAFDVSTRFREAAATFGPQKGASPQEVAELERRLDQLALLYASDEAGVGIAEIPGSGSAGGLAGGLAALGGHLVGGFDLVAQTTSLDELIATSNAVVTGEGTLDSASFDGKVVGGLIRACRSDQGSRPLLCVTGRAEARSRSLAEQKGVTVVVLSERFGEGRSLDETALLVRTVVEEWCSRLGGR